MQTRLAIDLTKIQPLDVLLISRRNLGSAAILAAESVARGRIAKVAHVGLFIAPPLLFEALPDGLKFTELAELPSATDLYNRRLGRGEPATRFRGGVADGQLQLQVELLPGEYVEVRRPKALANTPWTERYNLILRVLDEVTKLYLTGYPPVSSLLQPGQILSKQPQRWLDAEVGRLQRIHNPGAFCSELICQVLVELAFMQATPALVAPDDLRYHPDLVCVPGAVLPATNDTRLGQPLDEQDWETVISVLRPPLTANVELVSAKIGAVVEGIAAAQGGAFSGEAFRNQAGQHRVDQVRLWVNRVRYFWTWREQVEERRSSCPRNRRPDGPNYRFLGDRTVPCASWYACSAEGTVDVRRMRELNTAQ